MRRHRLNIPLILFLVSGTDGPTLGPGNVIKEMVGLARGGSRLRGTRIGAGPMGEDDRGEPAERTQIAYFCSQGHQCRPTFALQAAIPELWDCPRCGLPAGRDRDDPPAASVAAPYKTHLAYVRERRSDADAERLLGEALARLRNG